MFGFAPTPRPSRRRRPTVTLLVLALAAAGLGVAGAAGTAGAANAGSSGAGSATPDPATGLLPSGRQLAPQGTQVKLGNAPTGAAVTADGRFLWTVSAGFSSNDVRIVDTVHHRVCQTLDLPGASGGVALDSAHRLAYVSGLPNSRWQPSKNDLPGARGNVVFVYSWPGACGNASLLRVIPVPPPPDAPIIQTFPPIAGAGPAGAPQRSNSQAAGATNSWPQQMAVSPDGNRLLVALNLADHAAVIDLGNSDQVQYVPTGSYPFGAAVLPDGRTGLVTNEAAGTLSVVDLQAATKLADVTVGPPLSHPEGVVVDRAGTRAYVALSNSDQVVVVDLKQRRVERTISVGRSTGLGTMPVAVALSPNQERLYVAEAGGDEIAVIRLPGRSTRRAQNWTVAGRIPIADYPQAVVTVAARAGRPAQLMWVAAKGVDVGPNPTGPDPVIYSDPIFWAFNPAAPTTDVFNSVGYTAALIRGRAGLMTLPSDAQVDRLTPAAARQLQPVGAKSAPAGTPLRGNGPIKHVFFIVRENRSYDQLLGDAGRGNGDPKLSVFDKNVTPNLHSIVERFPLMDNVFANSEASIEGHSWTAGASTSDYLNRNWVQEYGGRGRPNDFGVYSVSWPGNGFLFDQAEHQQISYFNYGEGLADVWPAIPDRNRSDAQLTEEKKVAANSDLGPPTAGCYPSDVTIGTAINNAEIFDSSLPAGAPPGSFSHVDCFRTRFAQQLAAGAVPGLSYISLTSDHTRGTAPGFPTPTAMVADSDLAVGQMVDTISHSSIWSSSAIFVVEDDSQDGADHVDAHRIPVAVISPYARRGILLHTRYDLLSVVRSVELILGMKPLSMNDALAIPMYDAFTSKPVNADPVPALTPQTDLLSRNQTTAPDSQVSARLPLGQTDAVPQWQLDSIIWHSVYGATSSPPPPGPRADRGE